MSAFKSSTMGWDSARVGAAIPSGVGFLGAGLIWKGSKTTTNPDGSESEVQEVHGLTTAAGVWLSAALGMGAGGKLYIVSAYAVILVILVLRIGPRVAGIISDDGSGSAAGTSSSWYDTDGWETESEVKQYGQKRDQRVDSSSSGIGRGGGMNNHHPNLSDSNINDMVVSREEQRWLLEREAESTMIPNREGGGYGGQLNPTMMTRSVEQRCNPAALSEKVFPVVDIFGRRSKPAPIHRISSHPGFVTDDALYEASSKSWSELRRTQSLVPIRTSSSSPRARKKKRPRAKKQRCGLVLKD